jgi:hypothetical protein
MNIKFITLIIILLLLPTFSLLNIGSFPLLRVDFIAQIAMIVYIVSVNFGRLKLQTHTFLLFMFILVFYVFLNSINIIYFDDFNYFNYFKIAVQTSIFLSVLFLILAVDFTHFDFLKLYRYIINIGYIIALYGLYQIISWNIVELPYSSLVFNSPNYAGVSAISTFQGFIRPTSIFKEPGYLAFSLQLVVVIGMFANKYGYSKVLKLNFIKKIIITGVFLSTISLFSFISLFVVILTFFKKLAILIIFLMMIMVILIDDLNPFIRVFDFLKVIFIDQSLALTDGSLNLRLGRMFITLLIWLDNFWIGVGLYNIENFTNLYELGQWYKYDNHFVFSNIFLINTLAEAGFFGFLALFALFFYILNSLKSKIISDIGVKFSAHLSTALLLLLLINQDLPFTSSFRLIYLILIFISIKKVIEYRVSKINNLF